MLGLLKNKYFYICSSLLMIFSPLLFFGYSYDPLSQYPTERYLKPLTPFIALTQNEKNKIIDKFEANSSQILNSFEELFEGNPEEENSSIDFSNPQAYFEDAQESSKQTLENLLEPNIVKKIMELETSEYNNDSQNFILEIKGSTRTSLLGTDELGRDVYSRLILAAQNTLLISLSVALFSALIGIFVGGLAGFYGGLLDQLLMRLTDALLSLPLIPILIVLAAVDLNKVASGLGEIPHEAQGFLKVIFILSLFSWMTIARLVRGSFLKTKSLEFIDAAKSMGASDWRLFFSHFLPHTTTPVMAASAIVVGNAILIEAGLSFLGFGIQPPTPSLGNMLSNAQETIYEAPSLAIFPGLVISLIVLAIHFTGDRISKKVAKA